MKKYLTIILFSISILLNGCNNNKSDNKIKFATSADYPPFEYLENGEITGFEIELAKLIAKEMNKEIEIENMQFGSLLAALQIGNVDAVISNITITEERKQSFDFSNSYYLESLAVIYPKDKQISVPAQLSKKKIACQIGTTMEIWLNNHVADATISLMDSNNQAIEALKAGHVEAVLVDGIQGSEFTKKNPSLAYSIIAKSDNGYGIAVKKGSPLKEEINKALKILEEKGELARLKEKWLKEGV